MHVVFLFCIIGAVSSLNPAWRKDTEYVYHINGRTLTGLHGVSNDFTGVFLKARLSARLKSETVLAGKISNVRYAHFQGHLSEGWTTQIHEPLLAYKPLKFTDKPFDISLKNGVVHDVIVDGTIQNWEANIIKSVLSQIQLDTNGANFIQNQTYELPKDGVNNAVYKVMEDTVTGRYETLYEINPLPEKILTVEPWLVHMPHIKGNGQFIEVVRSKNFSCTKEGVGYHFGFSGLDNGSPMTGKMGDFFTRSSTSRAVLSGSLQSYTIQSSETTDKVIVYPTLNNRQHGLVVSQMNISLDKVQHLPTSYDEVPNALHIGNLIYRYHNPFDKSGKVRAGQINDVIDEHIRQKQPSLSMLPQSPLLPYYVGYLGRSIKYAPQVNIVNTATEIVKQIAQDLQNPEEIPRAETLSKYTILNSLTRVMILEELKAVAKNLAGEDAKAWEIYRDAVAECGTGPSFLLIKSWIMGRKLEGYEAAEVVASMAYSVRHPTEEYMRNFYTLITLPEVQFQQHLNITALLSYSELVRRVYFDRRYQEKQYPVQSFGSFRTESGVSFCLKEYVPYLAKQLNNSMKEPDARKVHAYIRALGNVGHYKILSVFEPYLEGATSASKFQRLQMVMAMDKLVEGYTKRARSVLYRIYKNQNEAQEIRTAAVYQLMRTSPSADMLQKMAEYTNYDPHEQVNAAVKSAIESAAFLQGDYFAQFRSSAQAAKPFLTPKTYGLQYSRAYLRSFIFDEMNIYYKQTLNTHGSEESYMPSKLKYSLRVHYAGLKKQHFNIQAMISSINDFTDLLFDQHYSQIREEKNNRLQEAMVNEFSGEYVGNLWKIKFQEKEPLEGSILFQLGNLQQLFSFDNNLIKTLPEVLQNMQHALHTGKNYRYTKFNNPDEINICFPMEMSLPFFYNLDNPTLLHIEGGIKLSSPSPKADSSSRSVELGNEMRLIVSTKIQGHIGFITPFDHHQYTSGYDKIAQIYLPLHVKIISNLKTKRINVEMQTLEPHNKVRFLHYSTWPFITRHDILNIQPLAFQHFNKILYKTAPPKWTEKHFGSESTGMNFLLKYKSENGILNLHRLYDQLNWLDITSTITSPWFDNEIQNSHISLQYDGVSSTTNKLRISLGYDQIYENIKKDDHNGGVDKIWQIPVDEKLLQENLMKMASSRIQNPRTLWYDVSTRFYGQKQIEYNFTAVYANSNVDQKSCLLVNLLKNDNGKPYRAMLKIENEHPAVSELDIDNASDSNPESKSRIQAVFGENEKTQRKVDVEVHFKRTERQRKRFLEKKCKDLPECVGINQNANIFDHISAQVQTKNLDGSVKNWIYSHMEDIKHVGGIYKHETISDENDTKNEGRVDIGARFHQDLNAIDFYVHTRNRRSTFKNIVLNRFLRSVIAVHPLYDVKTRLYKELLDLETFKPTCVAGKHTIRTFNGDIISSNFSSKWMLMYKNSPSRNTEQFSVYTRQSAGEQKDVKIFYLAAKSDSKPIIITITPTTSDAPKIEVRANNRTINFTDAKSLEFDDGSVLIHTLSNGEVEVKFVDQFCVSYDGLNVKAELSGGRYRNAMYGICGTNSDKSYLNFRLPQNCYATNSQQLIETYTLSRDNFMDNNCLHPKTFNANVISRRDYTTL